MLNVKISGVSVVRGDHHVLVLGLLQAGDQGWVEVVHLVAPEDTDSAANLQLRLALHSHLVNSSLQEILSGEDVRFVAPSFVHNDTVDVGRDDGRHPAWVEEALQPQQHLSVGDCINL